MAPPISAAASRQSFRHLPRGLNFELTSDARPTILFKVPDEYLTGNRIRGRVPTVELQRSHTDLLFFLFYAGHGDRLQLTAASLLFERGWRFNIPNQVLYTKVSCISSDTFDHRIGDDQLVITQSL